MDIKSIMTANPKCCTRATPLKDVARLMRDEDVGQIPVLEDADSRTLAGVLTDRDMIVRVLAAGTDPASVTAGDCMSSPVVTVRDDATLAACADAMASAQIRRVPVVDAAGKLCGIVSQADIQATDAGSLKEEIADRVSIPH